MQPAYTFLQLTSADIALLRELLTVFGRAFEDEETYHRRQPSDAYLQRQLARDHFIAVVARAGNTVVGGIAAYVLDKFEQDRREVYIYDLAVDVAHRRRGVARALIGELRQIAARLDAYVIFVQADIEDGPAIALYQSVGSREDVLHFDIAVP